MLITLRLQRHVEHFVDAYSLTSMFQSNGSLEGARVFARVFGILDDGLFQPTPSPLIVDLAPYDIYESEWLLLYGFLRNGFIPCCTESKLNTCYLVTLKLGGIPTFDAYLRATKTEMYNPMSPVEDTRKEYIWRVMNISSNLSRQDSVTIPYEHDSRYMYIRSKLTE